MMMHQIVYRWIKEHPMQRFITISVRLVSFIQAHLATNPDRQGQLVPLLN